MNGKRLVTAVAMTAVVLTGACGELAAPIPDAEQSPSTTTLSAVDEAPSAGASEPSRPTLRPETTVTPSPGATLTPPAKPRTPAEPGAPPAVLPESDVPAPVAPVAPVGAVRAPTEVPCQAGERVEMSIDVSPALLGLGPRPAYCTGVVEIAADLATWDASHWDTTKLPWVRISAVANGRSINPDPKGIVGLIQTSTLVYPDGKRVEQGCRFEVLCENGLARGVASNW